MSGALRLAAAALLLAACGSAPTTGGGGGATSSPVPVAGCRSAHFPFPPPAARLTAADSGRQVQARVGDLVEVTLLGSQAPGGRWPEITASGASLQALVNPANAATVGTQLAEYCAVGTGATTLTSGSWNASVDVR